MSSRDLVPMEEDLFLRDDGTLQMFNVPVKTFIRICKSFFILIKHIVKTTDEDSILFSLRLTNLSLYD